MLSHLWPVSAPQWIIGAEPPPGVPVDSLVYHRVGEKAEAKRLNFHLLLFVKSYVKEFEQAEEAAAPEDLNEGTLKAIVRSILFRNRHRNRTPMQEKESREDDHPRSD